jgi:hypothetical protein
MAGLLWKRDLDKKYESEIFPKIRRLETEYGDTLLSAELRQMKMRMNFESSGEAQKTLDTLDKVASQALEVYENEYGKIYQPIIEGLAEDGKIREVNNFFENQEKLSIALRIYSASPLRMIGSLREQVTVKEQMSRRYLSLIRESVTIGCTAVQDTLESFLVGFEKKPGDCASTGAYETARPNFFNIWEIIKWVAGITDIQKTLEARVNELEEGNRKLLDLLIFSQRHLSRENLNTLVNRVSELEIVKPGLTSREIEEFLPNLFLSGNMTDKDKNFCMRMRRSLATCVYERLSQIYPI